MNAMFLTDGYKLDHRRMYPEGTEYVYSNWTPRSSRYMPGAEDGAVVFGIQYLIKRYLIDEFNKNFFNRPKEEVVTEYQQFIDSYLGPNEIGTEHIAALHDLGYLPIRIKALPEGTVCPIRCPMLTIINTKPEFFWLTNYLETIISNIIWLPITSATTARLYKKELVRHARKTGWAEENLGFSCHDFSMRGMQGLEATILSGMGHLTSFTGSESLPAVIGCAKYYNAGNELIAATIPASEHSVQCSNTKFEEVDGVVVANDFPYFERMIKEVYPKGFVSIVSDGFDYWKVITEYLPQLKETILNRDGRVVIRPDSGDPVKIICGYSKEEVDALTKEELAKIPEWELKGTYQLLWDIFGGTVNEYGYKVLDPHIGLIYGDSITRDRQKEIYKRLERWGFAATNLVLGVGLNRK